MHRKFGEFSVDGLGHPRWVRALLLDRGGVLIENVPYLEDPNLVRTIAGVRTALLAARAAGLRLDVVTNKSGIGRGIVAAEDVERVNRLLDQELGWFDVWQLCPHTPEDWCGCRKPAPGLVYRTTYLLGLPPAACVVIGDRLTNLEAAQRAGDFPILVPGPDTTADDQRAAGLVVGTLGEAVDYVAHLEMAR